MGRGKFKFPYWPPPLSPLYPPIGYQWGYRSPQFTWGGRLGPPTQFTFFGGEKNQRGGGWGEKNGGRGGNIVGSGCGGGGGFFPPYLYQSPPGLHFGDGLWHKTGGCFTHHCVSGGGEIGNGGGEFIPLFPFFFHSLTSPVVCLCDEKEGGDLKSEPPLHINLPEVGGGGWGGGPTKVGGGINPESL